MAFCCGEIENSQTAKLEKAVNEQMLSIYTFAPLTQSNVSSLYFSIKMKIVMNKGRRHELKMLKYKKRLKQLGLKESQPNSNFTAYRSHGSPCSCWFCRDEKYRNNGRQKNKAECGA